MPAGFRIKYPSLSSDADRVPQSIVIVTASGRVRVFDAARLDIQRAGFLQQMKSEFDAFHLKFALNGVDACTPPDENLLSLFVHAEVMVAHINLCSSLLAEAAVGIDVDEPDDKQRKVYAMLTAKRKLRQEWRSAVRSASSL